MQRVVSKMSIQALPSSRHSLDPYLWQSLFYKYLRHTLWKRHDLLWLMVSGRFNRGDTERPIQVVRHKGATWNQGTEQPQSWSPVHLPAYSASWVSQHLWNGEWHWPESLRPLLRVETGLLTCGQRRKHCRFVCLSDPLRPRLPATQGVSPHSHDTIHLLPRPLPPSGSHFPLLCWVVLCHSLTQLKSSEKKEIN